MDRWLDGGKPSFVLRRFFNFRLTRRHAHVLLELSTFQPGLKRQAISSSARISSSP
jgi:hypothetical protein